VLVTVAVTVAVGTVAVLVGVSVRVSVTVAVGVRGAAYSSGSVSTCGRLLPQPFTPVARGAVSRLDDGLRPGPGICSSRQVCENPPRVGQQAPLARPTIQGLWRLLENH
jgi:hypothetical protein